MLMMLPLRCFSMVRNTALVMLNTLFMFVFITASKSASLMRMSNWSLVMPALFTRISSLPQSATTLSTAACAALKSPASLWMASTLRPVFAASSLATALAFSGLLT